MYTSYKSKKRNNKKYKVLLVLLIIALAVYTGNKYKQYVFFWEYTYNKLSGALSSAEKLTDPAKKTERLHELSVICSRYNDENLTSPEAYSLSARVHFELGELYSGGTFSDIIIKNSIASMSNSAKGEFIASIIDYKKMIALSSENKISAEDSITLAMACFYTDFLPLKNLYKTINSIDNPGPFNDPEFARFCAVIHILNGDNDRGLDLLKKYDAKSDSEKGRLFLATVYMMAGMYTNALLEFKTILEKTNDIDTKKHVSASMGRIYYNQSLFNESLYYFTNALGFDAKDTHVKIWVGKNYMSLGLKLKAKAIWNEVLAVDSGNEEAKKLLGLM